MVALVGAVVFGINGIFGIFAFKGTHCAYLRATLVFSKAYSAAVFAVTSAGRHKVFTATTALFNWKLALYGVEKLQSNKVIGAVYFILGKNGTAVINKGSLYGAEIALRSKSNSLDICILKLPPRPLPLSHLRI